jgi:hypothetical protein
MEIKLSSSILYIEQMNELVDKGFNKIQKIERKIVNDEKGSYIVIKMRILSNCPLSDVNDIFKDKNFVPGRKVMTCCADDTQFVGYISFYDNRLFV